MELLYIWIEEYKNIKEQGFNFSSKHHFEFIPEKDKEGKIVGGELCHEGNTNHIENFFGENITNVTAIIGENGAGKSSLLEFIDYWVFSWFFKKNLILIFQVDDKMQIIYDKNLTLKYNIDKIEDKAYKAIELFDIDRKVSDILNKPFQAIYYYNYYRYSDFRDSGNAITIYQDTDSLTYEKKGQLFHELSKEKIYFEDVRKQLLLISSLKHIRENIHFIPNILNIKTGFSFKDEPEQKQELIRYITEYYSSNIIELSKNAYLLNVYLYLLKENLNKVSLHIEKRFYDIKSTSHFIQTLELFLKEINLEYLIKTLKKISNYSLDVFNTKIETKYIDYKDLIILLQAINENTYLLKFFRFYWEGLSTGELAYFNMLARIYSTYDKIGNEVKDIILMIDEGELGFHPQWQKEYLKILIDFLPQIFPDKKIQIILTSHSPFLVSDLPKENIIFLSKNDKGECVVSKLQDRKETFGANIHTLFTDSFFMKGGLMGTFAQKRIDEVIAYLNGEESEGSLFKGKTQKEQQELAQKYILMIGEPIIKNMLQKQLNTKRLEKVESHEERIEKLEEELEALKKAGKTEL